MSHKLLCFLLSVGWLSHSSTAQAQADFRSGYVIPLSGDTVRGLADYRGSVRSAELCRFRPSPEAEITSYAPAQIRGYGFRGGRQYSSQLLVPTDSVQYQHALPPRPVFMELLAAGPLMLYFTRGKSGSDRYFVALAGPAPTQQPVELLAHRPADSEFVTQAYRRAPVYRMVLTTLLADCPTVYLQVASVPFTTSGLTSIVQRYNACRNPAAEATAATTAGNLNAAKSGGRMRLGLVLGAEASHLKVTGESFLANGHFVSSPLPVVGLGLTIPMATFSEKLSLRIEGLVEQQHYTDAYIGGINYNSNTCQLVELKLTYLRVPFLVCYTYPTGRLKPFAQLGMCYAQRLNFDNSLQVGHPTSAGTVEYGSVQPLENVVAGIVNYEIGVAGSLGLHLPAVAGRALTLEARLESNSGFIITSGISGSNLRYSALFGYNFTK